MSYALSAILNIIYNVILKGWLTLVVYGSTSQFAPAQHNHIEMPIKQEMRS